MTSDVEQPWLASWEKLTEGSVIGGQATVLKVKNRSTGVIGALKQIIPGNENTKRRNRMAREALALKTINDRGVPRILDGNTDLWEDPNSHLYIVMEWIEGKTLERFVSGKPLSINKAMSLTTRLAEILEICHREGVLHRDIKHDNIILREGKIEDPVIVDFGLAWQSDHEMTTGFLTSPGEDLTSRFLALPEAVSNMHMMNEVSDVTSLVGVLFYAVTGLAPRQLSDSQGKLPHEALSDQIPKAVIEDSCWPKLTKVFRIGFQQIQRSRFQHADELRRYLMQLDTKPETSSAESAIKEEHEKLEELFGSTEVSSGDELIRIMMQAHQFFLEQFELPKELTKGGTGPNAGSHGTQVTTNFYVTRQLSQDIQVRFDHISVTDGNKISSSFKVEGGPITYYDGPAVDKDSFFEAAKSAGKNCCAETLRLFREKFERIIHPDK